MSERPNPLVELTLARIREFLREPEAVFWVFAFPVLMALALGVAFRSQKPQEVQVGVLQAAGPSDVPAASGGAGANANAGGASAGGATPDGATAAGANPTAPVASDPDGSGAGGGASAATATAALTQVLQAAPGVRVRLLTPAESDAALRNGLVQLLVVPGNPPTYRYDPTRPDNHIARLTVDNALQRAAGRADVWQATEQQVLAPGSRYIDWLLPGLLGMNIMGTGLWSVGFSVVWARTRKLLKRFMATPMPRGYYLLSHMLARLGFLVLEVTALLVFGYVVFGVSVHGSIISLAVLCLLGALSFSGLGLLIACRAKTVEAVSGLMNVAMLPMWLLSGVFFASSNFPDAAQPFIKALPLTALNDALRGVMIDGKSLMALGPEVATLSAWGVGTFLLAIKLFRWR